MADAAQDREISSLAHGGIAALIGLYIEHLFYMHSLRGSKRVHFWNRCLKGVILKIDSCITTEPGARWRASVTTNARSYSDAATELSTNKSNSPN